MSATMDVDHFSKYFNKAPVFYIEGRQHKVDVSNKRHVMTVEEHWCFYSTSSNI